MIKVLVVDDSVTMRSWLADLLGRVEGFSVIGQASDGRGAIQQVQSLRPDIVVLDLVMPVLDGLGTTREIMAIHPVPIVILTTAGDHEANSKLHPALEAGALSIVAKPGSGPRDRWERDFIRTLKAASRMQVSRRRPSQQKPGPVRTGVGLVAIGASTGGPQLIASALAALPVLTVPLIVAVHAAEGVPERLSEWFGRVSPMPVHIARDGMRLASCAGQIIIAPNDIHLAVRNGILSLEDGAPRNFCKPSIDILFESIASSSIFSLCILLSGMGRDGAEGLLAVRKAGSRTVAQDEATSIVYGMPKAAVDLGAAEKVLAMPRIAQTIIHEITHGGAAHV